VAGENFWLSALNRTGFIWHFSSLLVVAFAVLAVLLIGRLLVFVCRLLFDRFVRYVDYVF